MSVNYLWNDGNATDWNAALAKYYDSPFVKDHIELEKRMEELLPDDVQRMSPQEFYVFLRDEYFVWKYTAKNRLETTRRALAKYETEGFDSLGSIKRRIIRDFEDDPNDTENLLESAKRIHGLGIAGASGLLSIMFPEYYGTLDQFLVLALRNVHGLIEHELLMEINEEDLTLRDGILLEAILRSKAAELNERFDTTAWTPRKLDMILWVIDRY